MALTADTDFLFDSEGRQDGLAGRTARGGVATLAGQAARTIIQVAGTVVLARLLTPDDYGLIGMATVVIGFVQLFKDAGLSTATVQQERITREQVSTLFWVNVSISVALSALVLAAAPLVAAFYHRPELAAITAALSVAFLLTGVSIQHEALLRRHMRFVPLAASQALGQLVGVAVSVVAALAGLGYWSLVLGTIATAIAASLVIVLACRWVPSRPRRGTGARKMLMFGSHVAGFNVLNFFARNGDYVLIGRFIGAGPLGIYTRAYQLFMQPLSQVVGPMASAVMPALCALRDTPERYAAYYRRFLGVLALLAVPMAAYVGLEAPFIVRVLLGSQWSGAVPVLRWLAITALFQAVTSTLGIVLVSWGRSEAYLQMGATNALAMLAGFVLGLPYGIQGVAAGYTLANLLYWAPATAYFTRGTPVRATLFWRTLLPPLVTAVAAYAAALAVSWVVPWTGGVSDVIRLIAFVLAYAAMSWTRRTVRDDVGLLARSIRGAGA